MGLLVLMVDLEMHSIQNPAQKEKLSARSCKAANSWETLFSCRDFFPAQHEGEVEEEEDEEVEEEEEEDEG